MSDTDLVLRAPAGDLTQFDPRKAATNNAKADAVIQYAQQIRNWPLLEQAVDAKIDQQVEFVQWWRDTVSARHGLNRHNVDSADPRTLRLADAEEQTQITHQRVSQWAARLEDREAYRSSLCGAAYRAAMLDEADEVHNHRAQGTGENEWYTPAVHVERVRALLGEIDLDPASSSEAQKIVRAKRYYTAKDSGLKHEWCGRVWLNPPYAQPVIQQFAQKWADETAAGRISESVMLTHNYTDTEWFHIAAFACDAICFTRGRIAFLAPDGTKAAPTQGQAFFYFGPRVAEFARAFEDVGFVR